MKIRKKILLSAISISPIFFIPFVSSCSQNNDTNIEKKEIMKKELEKVIDENSNSFNIDNVNIISSTESFFKNVNLFQILMNPSKVSDYFNFKINDLKIDKKRKMEFEFFYGIEDSFGNFLKPEISYDMNSINIPILIYYFDSETGEFITKYKNLFTLDIQDSVIEDKDSKYNNVLAKKVVFKNKTNEISFQSVPQEMVKKYFSFIHLIYSNNQSWKKIPDYQNKSSELKEWEGKTLSEVRKISGAIKAPTDYYDGQNNKYNYSIMNSFFDPNNRQNAMYIMRISLSSQYNNSTLIDDAKKIYGLTFEYDYTVYVDEWKFALPTKEEIDEYVNFEIASLSSLKESIKNTVLFCAPNVLISYEFANEKGASELVERFNRGVKDFSEPASLDYYWQNGQNKRVKFSISGIETNESEPNILTFKMKMSINENDLLASEEFEKKFDLKQWKFV